MKTKRRISVLLCIVMLASLLGVGAFAEEMPEWAVVDEKAEPLVGAALPAKYDLRTEGRVTPVKSQSPWSSCWAFGGIAAAETSILSDFGATYESSKLDLSERHLTYFALQPVTEAVDPNQVGEGMYTLSSDPNAAFDAGGVAIYITTLFSQGTGPVQEELFPYRGVNALTSLQYFDEHADEETMAQVEASAAFYGMTPEELIHQRAVKEGVSDDEMFETFKTIVRDNCVNSPSYSKHDDWSIPELDAEGQPNRLLNAGVVLKDGNILPAYWQKGAEAPNPDSIRAMKQELVNGHGIILSYYADQSGTYTMSSEEGGTMYNQYISQPISMNHAVCVVGYDDTYAAENFKQTPPGDGAWIVKNSWGSAAEATVDDLGNPINGGPTGIKDAEGKATGYFYLSYYDMSIKQAETMSFTSNLAGGEGFYVLQYDYMPAQNGFFATAPEENPVSAANVFKTEETVEIKSVSSRTSEENMRVTYAIYALNDDAENPTDGELVYRSSCNYPYAGFHRMDLDRPITVEANKSFSIVATASVLNDDGVRLYNVSANQGAPQAMAEEYHINLYSKAVVNAEESYLFADGEWTDWKDFLAEYANGMPVDNFSIKAYCVTTEPAAKRGDVNRDGTVNGKDVTQLRRYLAGGYGVVIADASIADVNKDGTVNGKDVTVLRRYLAGGYGVTLN